MLKDNRDFVKSIKLQVKLSCHQMKVNTALRMHNTCGNCQATFVHLSLLITSLTLAEAQ